MEQSILADLARSRWDAWPLTLQRQRHELLRAWHEPTTCLFSLSRLRRCRTANTLGQTQQPRQAVARFKFHGSIYVPMAPVHVFTNAPTFSASTRHDPDVRFQRFCRP